MKHIIREFLTYPARERNGVLVLCGIIALLLAGLGVSKYFVNTQKFDFTSFSNEVDAFNEQHVKQDEELYEGDLHAVNEKQPERFLFDPNTATAEELQRLGLSPKQVHAVMGFRSHGGFSSKEEFAKVNAIPAELYQSLAPYILIPAVSESPEPLIADKKIISINSADSLSLLSIDGVSPSLVKRILRFRNALGGFISKQQLMEVYGMEVSKYELVSARTVIETAEIKKININTCTIEQLSHHPYINYNVARSLVNYRAAHGSFRKVDEVRNCNLVNDDLYRKIVSYLTVDQ